LRIFEAIKYKRNNILADKKIYFASDFHLGFPSYKESREREDKIVRWLKEIEKDALEVYLVGDIFDFWFEYKYVVPKGFVRFLGQIAHMCDSGIKVHFFAGNHDTWVGKYISNELGAIVHEKSYTPTLFDKKFYIAHGDEVGKIDRGMVFLKWAFRNPFLQWCFARLHPNLAFGFASVWSHKSRSKHIKEKFEDIYLPKEYLYVFSKKLIEKNHYDYFVFGHRHMPMKIDIGDTAKYVNTGTWLDNEATYAEFDGSTMSVKKL